MELCQDETATLDDVARVVMTDPALSGKLIRHANAASMGGRPVVSVGEAVRRLGLGPVKQLSLGFSLVDQYGEGACEGFDYQAFWSHSLLAGLAMQRLARNNGMGPPDDLFACGLFSRIGRLALATAYPEAYAEILAATDLRDASALAAAERLRLQIDHNQLAAAMLADWGFPPALIDPVEYHEAIDSGRFDAGSRGLQICESLRLAVCIADLGQVDESARHALVPDLMCVAGRVGLDEEELGELLDPLIGQWHEWGEILNVPTHQLPSFAQIASAPPPRAEVTADGASLRILLVDDDESSRELIGKMLVDSCGHEVQLAADGRSALAMAVDSRPQVVITDWLMPAMDGLELTRALRATEWGQVIYVVMLTGAGTEAQVEAAFTEGVDDYLNKPVGEVELRARLRAAWRYVKLHDEWERDRAQLKRIASELAVSNRKLEQAALTDALTGLPNRRAGMSLLEQAWSVSRRGDQPLSLMMVDVDRFKAINDAHGHAGGDAALTAVATTLRAEARKDDWVCRVGGEEFLVICPNTPLPAAARTAERLRLAVRKLAVAVGDRSVAVTVSIGLAGREPLTQDADSLVRDADKALYAAKHAGRNRCCLVRGGKTHLGPA
ncbi:MAG: diguanylate cyclase [Rhodocyclaceae bacterium]|nr:diguanylate cyclase [Rhodocyclaceae bacterium]